jgi:hypothetical protein
MTRARRRRGGELGEDRQVGVEPDQLIPRPVVLLGEQTSDCDKERRPLKSNFRGAPTLYRCGAAWSPPRPPAPLTPIRPESAHRTAWRVFRAVCASEGGVHANGSHSPAAAIRRDCERDWRAAAHARCLSLCHCTPAVPCKETAAGLPFFFAAAFSNKLTESSSATFLISSAPTPSNPRHITRENCARRSRHAMR